MKIIVQKYWLTETEVTAPDNLPEQELKDWIIDNTDSIGNALEMATWDSTTYIDAKTDKEIDSW